LQEIDTEREKERERERERERRRKRRKKEGGWQKIEQEQQSMLRYDFPLRSCATQYIIAPLQLL